MFRVSSSIEVNAKRPNAKRQTLRRPSVAARGRSVQVPSMQLLATSDLHLVSPWRSRVVKILRQWIEDHRPEGVLIAGDLAVPAEAKAACAELRRCFPDGPIILCLGNHDFWVGPSAGD